MAVTRRSGGSMTGYQLVLMLTLLGSTVTPSPAQAGLDQSKVIADWLVNFTVETLPDLTTAPQRATPPNTDEWRDALAIAPADPADWTPITRAIPGVLIRGALKDDQQQGRFLLRLPMVWNGKLVVAGASGTRSEFNGDLVISDYVLQKGYAYASQNKGIMNFSPSTKSDPNACPLNPVADVVPGSDYNPLIYFFLLDNENSLTEWGERFNQA